VLFENLHYKPKKISEVNLKNDKKISLLGKIVEVREDFFILDDNSGKIEIFSDTLVEANKLIRVFCSVFEQRLKADVIQNLNGFDIDLFNRIEELYRKKGV
jgi:hypothetical protein